MPLRALLFQGVMVDTIQSAYPTVDFGVLTHSNHFCLEPALLWNAVVVQYRHNQQLPIMGGVVRVRLVCHKQAI